MSNLATTYLKDYTPPAYSISTIYLDVELTEKETVVTATMNVVRQVKDSKAPLILIGEEIELLQVVLDDKELPTSQYQLSGNELIIKDVSNEFSLQLTQKIFPDKNTALSGLYKSNKMYCTQCESQGFRRISYYLDRPDVMAKFTTNITANKKLYPVLLANGNCTAKGELPYDRHYATWEDPFLKPSYLFAMVAGDLICVADNFLTRSGRLVGLQFYVERPDIDKAGHAVAALKQAMLWDEQTYGREYDLDNYMVVAVHDFNMGAMENKGLNIFNASCVLANPVVATDANYKNIVAVVGHEYFHNWSGNRITCRDWFQLSLKEGFTVFREEHFVGDVGNKKVSRIEQANLIRVAQFAEDAGPMAHPVQPQSYVEINNFYTLTVYEKGAEVIRMLRTMLGEETFRQATDLYFATYDGQAVTIEEFVSSMEQASKRDLTQFRRWYTQAGTPEITVLEDYDAANKVYTLTLQQQCPETPDKEQKQPFHIPVAVTLYDTDGNAYADTSKVLELTDASQEFIFENIKAEPVASVLQDFSAPVKLSYTPAASKLELLACHDVDPFNQWDAMQQLMQRSILSLASGNTKTVELASLTKVSAKVLADWQTDPEFCAQLLSLPELKAITTQMEVADPDLAHKGRLAVMQQLVKANVATLNSIYTELNSQQGRYQYTPEAAGKRRLKNLCLHYLLQVETKKTLDIALRQYSDSDNMTDKIAVLGSISHIECKEREELLANFYHRYQDEPIACNKWLSIQAMATLPQTIAEVGKLLQHEAFSIKNPNNVYALLVGFCGNLLHFHAKDGAGYKLIAEQCIALNLINPQVGSRLLNGFMDFAKFSLERQNMIKEQLIRIQKTSDLKPDLAEKVEKALCQM